MSKKRTKKHKIRAAVRRRRPWSDEHQSSLDLSSATSRHKSFSATNQVRSPVSAQLSLQESLLGFKLDLIKQDLIKTIIVSSVIIVLVLALFVWL